MSRELDPTLAGSLSNPVIYPVIMVELTFKTQTIYAWTGVGNLVYGGNTFLGVGTLGKMGAITEGVEVSADGTTLTLSGIDKNLLGEAIQDIQLGAPANIWFGNFVAGQLAGTPYLVFSGCVDKPSISIGLETCSIQIALENKMIDLQRPRMRRYTSADQRRYYPTDTAFGWVEELNDLALVWGQ